MRRKDREVTDIDEIRCILDRAKIVHLGLSENGRPYVVPLHYGYVFDGGKLTLYMHGAREGYKYELINACSDAYVEIDCNVTDISGGDVPCTYGSTYASIMGRGTAEVITDPDEKKAGLDALMMTQTGRRFAFNEAMIRSVNVIRVTVAAYTAKARRA